VRHPRGRYASPPWLDATGRVAEATARATCDRAAASSEQAALLRRALAELPGRGPGEGEFLPALDVPSAVMAAVRGRPDGAADIAAATLLMEAGIYLLDHVADAELGAEWNGVPPQLVHLAGTGLATTLPQIALAGLDAPAEMRLRLGCIALDGLVRIAAGQQLDIEDRCVPGPDLERVERAVAAKTGERRALYATLAATFAGAPAEAVATYSAALRAYGVARQLCSDLYDLLADAPSRDLATGTRTWPVAWQLSRLTEPGRSALLELLDAAKGGDDVAQREVRGALVRGGAIVRTMLEAERHCVRARAQLRSARPRQPGAGVLAAMIDAVSPARGGRS
jgi:hypothetical protein